MREKRKRIPQHSGVWRRMLSVMLAFAMVITLGGFDGITLKAAKIGTQTKQQNIAFQKNQTIDGVIVSVTADAGVFPEGATLSVSKVDADTEEMVTDNVDAVRDENVNVAKSYTFDIKVLDAEGNELQPDISKGNVKVSFATEEVISDNLDAEVYHISDAILNDESLNAEKLDSSIQNIDGEQAVVAETTGFSFYTVEFTYNNLQYVLNGDTSISLSEILKTVGLTGTVENAISSNPDLFSVEKNAEGKDWTVSAKQAFTSNETLKVTIDGTNYVIIVTDALVEGIYYIATGAELIEFLTYIRKSANTNTNAVLTANINLTATEQKSLVRGTNPYTGIFDGNGHSISGWTGSGGTNDSNRGALITTLKGTVKNLTLVAPNITCGGTVGGGSNGVRCNL